MRTYTKNAVDTVVVLQQFIDGTVKDYESDYLGHHYALVSKKTKKGELWITLIIDLNGDSIEIARFNAITIDDPAVMFEIVTSTIYEYFN